MDDTRLERVPWRQAEAMLRYYQRAVLLVEFEHGKPFSLQSASDVGQDISPAAITSKLSLLLIHHPKARFSTPESPLLRVGPLTP